jgi:hypothetical protein
MALATSMLAGCLLGAVPARADHHPALIVPGNPTVPVILNGLDASWAVVEGDWGLHRAGHIAPIITFPHPIIVDHWHARGYFPITGKRPRYGRLEVVPPANRRLPPPAESFHRYWSTSGAPPATITEYPGFEPPPVILAPRLKSLN